MKYQIDTKQMNIRQLTQLVELIANKLLKNSDFESNGIPTNLKKHFKKIK